MNFNSVPHFGAFTSHERDPIFTFVKNGGITWIITIFIVDFFIVDFSVNKRKEYYSSIFESSKKNVILSWSMACKCKVGAYPVGTSQSSTLQLVQEPSTKQQKKQNINIFTHLFLTWPSQSSSYWWIGNNFSWDENEMKKENVPVCQAHTVKEV